MIIHVEGFDQNNNYISKSLDTKGRMIKNLGKWACYDWFKDGIHISPSYNNWKDNDTYEIIFNHDYINLYIMINNKNIITPLINRNSTIEELKDILSIKDNIYFDKVKLKNDRTLESYNINNMDKLMCNYELVVASC